MCVCHDLKNIVSHLEQLGCGPHFSAGIGRLVETLELVVEMLGVNIEYGASDFNTPLNNNLMKITIVVIR